MRLRTLIVSAIAGMALTVLVWAQAPADSPAAAPAAKGSRTGGRGTGKRPPSDPTPRWPDGHPRLGAAPGKTGFWNSGIGGLTGKNGVNLPTNMDISEVPFKPWAKALYEARRADQQKNDPHARCMPPGGPRQFHTPYGLALYEL